MAQILEKIADVLLSKHWTTFLISIVGSIIASTKIPSETYDKLPLASHEHNVYLGLFTVTIIIYLVLTLIQSIINKMITLGKKHKEKRVWTKEQVALTSEGIERWKTEIDSWGDEEYSIVMYLLENKNKKPYIKYHWRNPNGLLAEKQYFLCSPYNEPAKPHPEEINGEIVNVVPVGNGYQYLLTNDFYNALAYILEKTGNISHFNRTRVELHQ